MWQSSLRSTFNWGSKIWLRKEWRLQLGRWQAARMTPKAEDIGRKLWLCDATNTGRMRLSNCQREDYSNSMQWKRHPTWRCTFWETHFTRFFGDAWIPKLKGCKTWTEWLSLTDNLEQAWHSLLNLYTSDLVKWADTFASLEKRPRDDSNLWNVAWLSDSYRRLEILGDSKVIIKWMNGDWEVKGNEHNVHVRNVIYQFVLWYLGGIFVLEMKRFFWCRHVFSRTRLLIHMQIGWWTMEI